MRGDGDDPRSLAVMRIALGLALLVDAVPRWPHAVELYSRSGLPMPLYPGTWMEPPALSAEMAVAAHSLLLFALVCVALGWQARLSLGVSVLLTGWLGLLDITGTFTKYSVVALHLMTLLLFTRSGAVWSLDAWWQRRRGASPPPPASRWPRRLMQLLVCAVYLGAAATKIRQPGIASGDYLGFVLLDDRWARSGFFLTYPLAMRPKLLVLLGYAAVFYEIAFPLLIHVRRCRRPMLILGVLFHLGLAAVMTIGVFTPVMFAALLAFVEPQDFEDAQRMWDRLKQRLHRSPKSAEPGIEPARHGDSAEAREETDPTQQKSANHPPRALARSMASGICWLLVAVACVTTGIVAQQPVASSTDANMSNSDAWPVVEDDDVDAMLAEQLPAYEDYFHRITLGERVGSGLTFGAHREFEPGMTVHCLARLIREHPPLRLEWQLFAPDGQQVADTSGRIAAGTAYASAGFRMTPELPPGQYRVVLLADDHEVWQDTFRLIGDQP